MICKMSHNVSTNIFSHTDTLFKFDVVYIDMYVCIYVCMSGSISVCPFPSGQISAPGRLSPPRVHTACVHVFNLAAYSSE